MTDLTVGPDAPSAPAPEASPPAPDVEREVHQLAITELAKEEDATDAIKEFHDQQAYKKGDPAYNNDQRKQEREARYRRLLEHAKADTDSALYVSQNQYEADQAVEARIQAERHRAQAEVRADLYERENPGFRERAEAAVEAYGDISGDATSAIYASPLSPEIADIICHNPEYIQVLNQLPPRELDMFVARMEGLIEGSRWSAPKAAPRAKTISTAPKPVSTVTGRSSAPAQKDLNTLAQSEDATAFIRESRRRERAKREAWGE